MESMKWLTRSQSIVLFGMGIVFPFYIIFINKIGANFTEFGIAFAIFSISAALAHKFVGKYSDRFGRKIFLLINSWGIAVTFLLFPIVTTIMQVYVLQAILGIFGAMQKTSEKAIVADLTDGGKRGLEIGSYHGWIAIFSALAVIAGGYLIDIFTLDIIFYIGSVILFLSSFATLKIKENEKTRA